MARKKKTRPLRQPAHVMKYFTAASHKEASTVAPTFITPRFVHQIPTSISPSVQRAHQKHVHDNDPVIGKQYEHTRHPSLGDLFHSLPTELRLHIFSFLLTTPVKWDAHHTPDCLQLRGDWACRDSYYAHTRSNISYIAGGCVRCYNFHYSTWRNRHREEVYWATGTRKPFIAPWRSKWAPDQRNPYVCTECYDRYLRATPFPRARELPCLCARRQNLEVLLVCRKWYDEAALLLYSSNTFAFEDCTTFIDFMHWLPSRWKQNLSKVSLMAYYDPDGSDFEFKSFGLVCSYLRKLPSLSHLELDAAFLTRTALIFPLLRLGLPPKTRISFTLRRPSRLLPSIRRPDRCCDVWPELAHRVLLKGGLAEEVARAMRGERRAWLPRSWKGRREVFGFLVEDYRRLIARINMEDAIWPRVVYCMSGSVETGYEPNLQLRRWGEKVFEAGGCPESRWEGCFHCDDVSQWERLWYGANRRGAERARVCRGYLGQSFDEQMRLLFEAELDDMVEVCGDDGAKWLGRITL